MRPSIIELKGLTKQYAKLRAVDNLNLTIEKGEIYGLLGPNGAGKSTTILMMLGLTEPTAGTAMICGINATLQPIEVKRRVGYLPDNVGFYENRTGFENLRFIARLNQLSEEQANQYSREILARVGLSEVADKKVSTYSRGMRQRLGLADVLIKQPEVIILDEPTLGIDPKGVKELLQLIVQLSREDQLTVLLSSHHLHQVQQVCDRVGLFVKGKLLASGDIPTLSKALFTGDAFHLEIGVSFSNVATDDQQRKELQEKLQNINGVSSIRYENGRFYINSSRDNTASIAQTVVGMPQVDLVHLSKRAYGLDDIYQRYFEETYNDEKTI